MAHATEDDHLEIELRVMVSIDPKNDELLERISNSPGTSPADMVCSEVESNLESVAYVLCVRVEISEQ